MALWALVVLIMAASGAATQEPTLPVTAIVLGEEVRADTAEDMQAVILDRLLDDYAAERGITASDAEISAYLQHFERIVEQDRAERAARIAEIDERLQTADLAADEREALEAERNTAIQLQTDLAADEDQSPEEAEQIAMMRREMAGTLIERWKLNRALYREYGGRVIFQQFGPEPLDAYRRFLEGRRADGRFRITEPTFEADFWRYFTDDSIHSFYDTGSEAEVFETPPWQAGQ